MTTYFPLINRHAKCIITSKFRPIESTCYDSEPVFVLSHSIQIAYLWEIFYIIYALSGCSKCFVITSQTIQHTEAMNLTKMFFFYFPYNFHLKLFSFQE